MRNDPTEIVLRRIAKRIVQRLKGPGEEVTDQEVLEVEGVLINDLTNAGFVRVERPTGERV